MRGKKLIAAIALLILAAALGSLDYHTSRYDKVIRQTTERYAIDFFLVKSLIYEESWFRSEIRGPAGEIGLMQITRAAASDFAAQNGIPPIQDELLFKPELNVEIGCWYLRKSIEHYKNSPQPTLYALLRYNAGESRADNWLRRALSDPPPGGISLEDHYLSLVDFPKTRAYARRILRRARTHNFWF